MSASMTGSTSTRFTRVLGAATLLGTLWLFLFGLFLSPDDIIQRRGVRIMYVHVPSVWLAYLAFVVTGIASVAYLWNKTRSLVWDRIAGASAEIGILFMAVTLVTGSLWGRLSWGKYWVWDARLTSTALMFVTYVGYLAVRNLGGTHQQRAKRSALVAIFAVIEIPLVHFSVERWNTLHQEESVAKGKLQDMMLFSLFSGIVTFTLLYVWLLIHRQRVLAMQDALDDRELDRALIERRAEADAAAQPATTSAGV
ncbi:MAG TPA: cytochrome c biogenesis protein CcsA [Ilumatobacteraceae bacterium]|nr:cytochrome c biogenesis protein CcsA [Ilumatobacteraceae bacterium]